MPLGASCPPQRWLPTCSRRPRSATGSGRTSGVCPARPGPPSFAVSCSARRSRSRLRRARPPEPGLAAEVSPDENLSRDAIVQSPERPAARPRREPVGARDHDRGHPVGPPDLRRPTPPAKDAMHRLSEKPEGHLLAARRERPGCGNAPTSTNAGSSQGRLVEIKPVRWDLVPGGCPASTVTERPRRRCQTGETAAAPGGAARGPASTIALVSTRSCDSVSLRPYRVVGR